MPDAAPIPAKKLEILKLAFDRFYDGGFHATGIDTVMAESGISKRTLYKYFASKEDLIEAVLDYYGEGIADAYFAPAMATDGDPRQQILACFDSRRMQLEADRRGCLGIKASQEYAGKHEGIAARGERLGLHVEQRFIGMCGRLGVADPEGLGKQIAILFQGALLMSQVCRNPAPFASAKAAVETLLQSAKR
ncbi:TetR/AcrR family transcriptional regulator [Rhizobium sp. BE258]|jgi:AcrR family transcriptional regulator|uniref:TetR/AcrR family transcriptional regulator n=2 Tax=Bacteria TaxID=2 RepID=UPI0028635AC0|nr:TetR/AcrR family transcriptional regulator [Rhizobium sp. BE258]MDR7142246.1 AcrR family transcriptional regulator [Rhizobium sp. BE258]